MMQEATLRLARRTFLRYASELDFVLGWPLETFEKVLVQMGPYKTNKGAQGPTQCKAVDL